LGENSPNLVTLLGRFQLITPELWVVANSKVAGLAPDHPATNLQCAEFGVRQHELVARDVDGAAGEARKVGLLQDVEFSALLQLRSDVIKSLEIIFRPMPLFPSVYNTS
jgi:hypothetical protein